MLKIYLSKDIIAMNSHQRRKYKRKHHDQTTANRVRNALLFGSEQQNLNWSKCPLRLSYRDQRNSWISMKGKYISSLK
jgi:hypothetical protein